MELDRENNAAYMTYQEFRGLLEYSASYPTGQTEGKVWKRHWIDREGVSNWWLGQYGRAENNQVPIYW